MPGFTAQIKNAKLLIQNLLPIKSSSSPSKQINDKYDEVVFPSILMIISSLTGLHEPYI